MAESLSQMKITIGGDISGLKRALGEARTTIEQAGRKMQTAGRTLTAAVTAPIAAIGAGAIKAFTDYDSALAGVRKTVDATPQAFAKLEKELQGLNRRLPSSQEEIFGVAEAAGQLGVATEDISEFTETMINLGETTNLSADEAATELARFMNVMGTAQQDVSNLGSTVVDLGNNFATTEAEIVAMGSRLSGAGSQMGLTEGEVLGLATALTSVGISAEAGGSAFSRVMVEMQNAAEKFRAKGSDEMRSAGDAIDHFAQTSGMSMEEFARAVEEEPNKAISGFVTGLGDVQESGGSVNGVLQDLGLDTIRVADALKRSSSAGDLMADAMNRGNVAFDENTALVAEAEQRYATLESKIQVAQGAIKNVAAEIGENLAPFVEKAAAFITDMGERFQNLSEGTQNVIIAVSAFAAAIGPVIWALGSVTAAAATLGITLGGLAAGGGAVLAFAAAATLIVNNWQAIVDFFAGFIDPIEDDIMRGLDAVHGLWVDFREAVSDTVSALMDNLAGIFDAIGAVLEPIVTAALGLIMGVWNEWGDNVLTVVSNAFETIFGLIRSAGDVLEGAFKAIAGVLTGNWEMTWEGIKLVVQGVWNAILEIVKSGATLLLNGLEAAFSWVPVLGPKIAEARDAVRGFIDDSLKADLSSDAEEMVTGAVEKVDTGTVSMQDAFEDVGKKAGEVFGPSGTATRAVETGAEAIKQGTEQASAAVVIMTGSLEAAAPAVAQLESNAVTIEEQLKKDAAALNEMAISADDMNRAVQQSAKDLETSRQSMVEFETAVANGSAEMRDNFNSAIDDSVDVLVRGGNPLTAAIGSVKGSMNELIRDGISNVIKSLLTGSPSMESAVGNVIGGVKGLAGALTGEGGGGLLGGIRGAIGGIGNFVGKLVGGGGGAGGGAGGGSALGAIGGLVSGVKGAGSSLMSLMGAAGPWGLAAAGAFGVMKALGVDLGDVWGGIKDGAKAVGNAIGSAFKAGGKAVKAVAKTLFAPYKFAFNQIKKVGKAVTGAIGGFFRGMGGVIKGIAGGIKSAFSGAFNAVKGIARGAANAVGGIVSGIGSAVSGVAGAIGGLFGGGEDRGGARTERYTLAWYIDKLKGINDADAIEFASMARQMVNRGAGRGDIFRFFKRVSDEGVLGPEEINPIYSKLGLQRGGIVMGDMMARLGENMPVSGPEVVMPLNKLPDLMRRMNASPSGQNMRQEINIHLDRRVLGQVVAEELPRVLDLYNLR